MRPIQRAAGRLRLRPRLRARGGGRTGRRRADDGADERAGEERDLPPRPGPPRPRPRPGRAARRLNSPEPAEKTRKTGGSDIRFDVSVARCCARFTLYCAPFRLLRLLALCYAPFSRTVKDEGA